jgi:phosphodiesterase/alkaline phosphatase D-like protein
LGGNEKPGNSLFSFDELKLSGSKVTAQPENAFGPVLWTMHTLSKGTVKMMALLPPVGEKDNHQVNLQLNENGNWETIATERIEPDSRTAIFKLENWDASKDTKYRVEYIEKGKDGTEMPDYYEGTIRKDPVDRPLKFGGLTCQFHFGFPYTPLVQNLTKLNPDILYFSGDQIYEGNGGYPIKREPADVSILSYLGKYYMFGWAFGDLMRDVPTICTPDDHDVFHGNLWGESGIAKPGGAGSSDTRGFMQSVEMVNVVNRTQCAQLPDPYDPTPIEQGMSVWYTDLNYGRVSFAIISDRIFKTGPEAVSDWEGRHDHMVEPREDLSFLDKPGVELIGERQTKFLNDWITDWKNTDMKVLLSQTVFANVATHHGGLEGYLYGDLDSGGWPKSGRDKVIRLMRKGAVFHINGDQHVPSLVQYGLKNYRDAGWSYCTPAIAVMYLRWFLPDELGRPVTDRPEHNYPNTGKYEDAFGNKNYVYAIGNPGKNTVDRESRYNHAQIRSSGFGLVTFNQAERTILIDAWRFKADVENPNPVRDQFPGWPLQISQFDNLGLGADNVLPEISVNQPNQVMQIWNEKTGELAQIYRVKGNTVQPKLFENGTFTIIIGEDKNKEAVTGLQTKKGENPEKVLVEL